MRNNPCAWCGALWGALLAGCLGTETGNPPDSGVTNTAVLKLGLHTSDASVATVGEGSEATRVLDARVGVEGIDLIECEGSVQSLRLSRSAVTLSSPSEALAVQPGTFCQVSLRLVPLPLGYESAQPAALPDLSLVVHGVDAFGTEFVIRWAQSETIDLLPSSGSALRMSPGDAFVLSLDVAELVNVFQLNAAPSPGVAGPDTGDPNPLGSVFSMHRDDNADGTVQDGESSVASGPL